MKMGTLSNEWGELGVHQYSISQATVCVSALTLKVGQKSTASE